ncbi:MAG: carbohydrate ABC transporter permease [Candidatus Binataceae bacterium]
MTYASRRLIAVFVAVPAALLALILVAPALQGAVLSFDSCGPSLQNYSKIFSDPMFWTALANNLTIPVASLALELVAGLALAMLLTARRKPGAVIEIAAILPFAIPEIVLLALARFVFTPRGYLNGALDALGVGTVGWLDPGHATALATVIAVDAWHVTPIVMLILIAGLQAIPAEVYEAAELDGAGPIATFRYITLPLLAPALAAAVVLRGVDALRIFSTTLVLTGAEGVPVLSTYAYLMYTDGQEPRVAMAASVLLAALITVIGLAGISLSRRFGAAEVAA